MKLYPLFPPEKVLLLVESTKCKVLIAAILFLIIALAIIPLFGYYFHHINHNRLWLAYSPSLPDYVPHFLGREKEISELVMMLDPENKDVRTVSIVGPPGFGKSSLAIHVGHEMIDRGVVMNYVNLDEVTLDGLPEKVVSNAGITTKNTSLDRLIKWAKEVKYPVVLILDNCDVILHEKRDNFQNLLQRVRRSAGTVMIKFLLTTKHKFNIMDEFEEYPLEEISTETSCKLLHRMAKFDIDEQTCTAITNLTGNVPLALKVVGAILRTRKRNVTQVIQGLRDELLNTLSPPDLDQKVNASLSLSYNYLTTGQRKIGRYLALFPGSFAADDACHILGDVIENMCSAINAEIEVLSQRSLLHSLGKGRYQFHKIIKEFFVVIKRSHDAEKDASAFVTRFLVYYGQKLYQLSLSFERDYASALYNLDVEKHNFQYLLEHMEDVCLMDSEQSLFIYRTIQIALQMRFLTCRFTVIELEKPLADICSCVVHIIHTIPGVEVGLFSSVIDPKEEGKVVTFMDILIHIAIILHNFNLHDSTPLEEVKVHLGMLEDIINIPATADFYYVLGSHYHTLGKLDKEKGCHEKILQRANAELENCQPGLGSCDYYTISRAYYRLGKYELGAHFLELDLKHNEEKLSLFYYAKTLSLLYHCQYLVGNHTKAGDTLTKLLHILPSLVNASIPEVYANFKVLSEIASIFRLKINGMTDEATQLEKRQIMAIKEMNATESHHDEQLVLRAYELTEELLEAEQYEEVPEVAECALNILQKWNIYIKTMTHLKLMLAKAEYHNGKKAESIKNLKQVARTVVYDHPEYHEIAQEACQYLIAQSYFDVTCALIIWSDFKTAVHSVFLLVVSDTITVDSFTVDPSNQRKAFSTDIAPSSAYLDLLPSELVTPAMSFYATILDWCMQIIKNGFYTVLNLIIRIFSISFLLRLVNCVFIPAKLLVLLLLLCVCCCCPSCCSSCCFMHMIRMVFRKCTSNRH